jgi:Ca2+-binding RTX toxin-like protein
MARAICSVLALLLVGALLAVRPAAGATVVGTNDPETIRGTPAADRLSGRGGNDVLIGRAGRDVVDGGRGADRLVLRDGERDTAICGPGRDVVLVDPVDVVLGDCETMRVSPPDPQAPPPRPVVPGLYGGRTTQGELVSFQVSSGGALTRLVFPAIHLSCAPIGRPSLAWSQDFGSATSLVGRDGTFTIGESGTRLVEGAPATYRIVVSGLLTVGIATGSVESSVDLVQEGTKYACDAPGLRWTAAAATLTGP